MKAVVYTEFGSPEVLHIKEIDRPSVKDEEVLVKVRATTVNYGDLVARNFKNISFRDFHMPLPLLLPSKIYFGLTKPRVNVLGSVFSGEIESIGKDVTQFKVGDEVFGYLGQSMGAYAEYLSMPENKMIGFKPGNVTHEEAACIPYGAIMAMSHLGKVNIKSSHKVLINGASGGIGSAAVQLAKRHGAEVTGVCGTLSIDYVKSLGADHVIDYKKEDFTRNGEKYDLIYDILGKSSFEKCKGSLHEGGTYLLASFKTKKILQMLMTKFSSGRKVICAMASEKQEDMKLIKDLVDSGEITAIIDRSYSLEEAAEAHRYVEKGQKKGNVVITVG